MRLRFEDYSQRSRSDTLVAYARVNLRDIKRQECRFYGRHHGTRHKKTPLSRESGVD